MDFSEALKAMKMGSKVSRELWRGKVSFWQIKENPPGALRPFQIIATYPNELTEQIHSMIDEDILAEDWWLVT